MCGRAAATRQPMKVGRSAGGTDFGSEARSRRSDSTMLWAHVSGREGVLRGMCDNDSRLRISFVGAALRSLRARKFEVCA